MDFGRRRRNKNLTIPERFLMNGDELTPKLGKA
jgi:hypothetical protein